MKATMKVVVLAIAMGAIIQTIYAGSSFTRHKVTSEDLIQLIEAHENNPDDVNASRNLDRALEQYRSERKNKKSSFFSIFLDSEGGPGV